MVIGSIKKVIRDQQFLPYKTSSIGEFYNLTRVVGKLGKMLIFGENP
jgi:hypothetical protein